MVKFPQYSRRHFPFLHRSSLLKCWLLAIALQSGHCLHASQEEQNNDFPKEAADNATTKVKTETKKKVVSKTNPFKKIYALASKVFGAKKNQNTSKTQPQTETAKTSNKTQSREIGYSDFSQWKDEEKEEHAEKQVESEQIRRNESRTSENFDEDWLADFPLSSIPISNQSLDDNERIAYVPTKEMELPKQIKSNQIITPEEEGSSSKLDSPTKAPLQTLEENKTFTEQKKAQPAKSIQQILSDATDEIKNTTANGAVAPANPTSKPTQEPPQGNDQKTPHRMTMITPTDTIDNITDPDFITAQAKTTPASPTAPKEVSINFNNVSMIEYIRFISRISNKNFIFDDQDLQFNVTIVSEEPTTVENLMAALLQELRIRSLSLIEQGNNIIIHTNSRVRAPAHVQAEGLPDTTKENEIVTRVFRLNTLDPLKAGEIIRPLLSDEALVEVLRDTNNLIITDLTVNVNKISQLISSLDAPHSGVTVGQYVVRNGFVDTIVELATKILAPIAQGNPYILVPHELTNSIFVVSNPFIVEKALAILENLDFNEGRTKILSLDKLHLREQLEGAGGLGAGGAGGAGAGGTGAGGAGGLLGVPGAGGGGITGAGPGGIPVTPPGVSPTSLLPGGGAGGAAGAGGLGAGAGEGYNIPGTPGYNPNLPAKYPFGVPGGVGGEGRPGIFESNEFVPGGISTNPRWVQGLPVGHIERTLFFIYKLKYRKGDQIEVALRKIGENLLHTGNSNADMVAAINSSQWIEASNSLIFTGSYQALERVKELILEIDLPLRQVYIEVLVLDTTIADSLTYGVDWGTRFGGGNTAGGQSFLGLGSVLDADLNAGTNAAVTAVANILPPSTASLLGATGYQAGIIGRHLTHGGLHFNTIGALIQALYTDTNTSIVMTQKIITEDNNPAEIFVGSTQRYKTQSISNDQGSVITNNFQFLDVGTTFRVTPQIGNNGIITLDVIQENTNDNGAANATSSNPSSVDVNLVPVLNKSRTTTRLHVPDGFFVIISGMVSDTETDTLSRIPCLGGIPLIGGISKQQGKIDSKRNIMLFIRPLIVDTEEELENITKRQQDVLREKNQIRRTWNYEIDEALDFFSIKSTNPNDYPPVK